MTKNQFENTLNVAGGQFAFSTDKYEGMVGVSPASIVIWVDDKGFGESHRESAPRNVGCYKNVKELLSDFHVDGKSFADSLLPQISELRIIVAD